MTKRELDNYFNENYDELTLYATKMYTKRRKHNESPYALISGCYEYLLERVDQIQEDEVHKWASTFIYRNAVWSNGFTEKLKRNERNRYVYNQDYMNWEIEDEQFDTFVDSTDEKLALIEYYYTTLTTLEERAVWEIYFIHKCTTMLAFANYIKLSVTVAAKYVRALRQDLIRFYEDYKANPSKYNLNQFELKIDCLESPEKVLNKRLNK